MPVQFESTTLASPSSTTIVASDTIAGIDYQRIKAVWGTTGSVTEVTTASGAGLPVQVTGASSALSVTLTSGTAALGSVGISSGTVTLTSGVLALGSVGVSSGTITLTSGTLALGTVTLSSGALDLGVVGSQSDVLMYNSATGLTITPSLASLIASATSTTSGNQIVAAPTAGTQIRVVSMFLMTNTATNLQFGSSAGVIYTGITPLSSNSGYVLPFNPVGWFGASSSTLPLGLYAYLSAAATVGGAITYVSV